MMKKDGDEERRRDVEGWHEKRRRHEEELTALVHALALAGLPRRGGGPRVLRLFLLALAFARSVARVALGLLFGLKRRQPRGFFFLFACDPLGFSGRSLFLAALLLGLFSLARGLRLGALGGDAPRARPGAASSAGSSGPGAARNLLRMSFRACCAAFWRSAKLGSLKPLIEEALLLSWLVADGENRFDASVGEPKAKCQRPIEAKQGRFGREQPVAKGDSDECRDVGLADLRDGERHGSAEPGRCGTAIWLARLRTVRTDRLARKIRDREMSSDRHPAGLIQSHRTILKNSNQV